MFRSRRAVIGLAAAVVAVAGVGLLMRGAPDGGRSIRARQPPRDASEGVGRTASEPAPSAMIPRIDVRRVVVMDPNPWTHDDQLERGGPLSELSRRAVEIDLQEWRVAVGSAEDVRSRLADLHAIASSEGQAAERALAEIARDPAVPVPVRRQAALLLANRAGELAYETLVALLEAEATDLRLAAAQGIGVLGDAAALDRLAEVFSTETSPGIARAILQAMGRIGTPQAVDALLAYSDMQQQLGDVSRGAILGALAGISNPAAVPALTSALNDVDEADCRLALVSALARIADPSSFDILLLTLQRDPELQMRCQAMQGLGLIGDPRALPALRSSERTGGAKERSYAQTAIRRIGSRGA